MQSKVCLLSAVKDEGPYLVEWIAHNLILGIDRIVIGYNDCSDGTDLILQHMQSMGLLRTFENPPPYDFRGHIQRTAFQRARKFNDLIESEWVLIIDADEFLNLHGPAKTLPAFIDTFDPSVNTIQFCCRNFGSSGLEEFEDLPTIERFTWAASREESTKPGTNPTKHLFRDHADFNSFSPHGGLFHSEARKARHRPRVARTAGGVEITEEMQSYVGIPWRNPFDMPEWSAAQINHYAIKSRKEHMMRNVRGEARGRAKYDLEHFEQRDRNTEHDTTIFENHPHTLEKFQELMADAELARLHAASVAHHMAVIQSLN